MKGLAQPLAIVAHDAGAANIIVSWAAEAPSEDMRAFMVGPAGDIWRARFGEAHRATSLAQALTGAACLLSGTGWASDVEHDARRLARQAGVRSVAVVDHWVNYRERFERADRILPDEIWVTDASALEMMRHEIPDVPARLHDNPYLAAQAQAAGDCPIDGDILFLMEPARSTWERSTQGEFQALDYFCDHRADAGIHERLTMRVRPHPSDPPGKYDEWLGRHAFAGLDTAPDMGSALRPAKWVVGLQSFGLVIGMAAGRRAISALPPHAPACKLPHPQLTHLKDVVGSTVG